MWQEGSHPQAITDDAFDGAKPSGARQTEGGASARRVPPEGGINLVYLHENPVKCGLVMAPEPLALFFRARGVGGCAACAAVRSLAVKVRAGAGAS